MAGPDRKRGGGAPMTQWIYSFGGGTAEGAAGMSDLLGGKGANLAEMSGIGLPVPPGFTVTTEVCTWYYDNGPDLSRRPRRAGRRRHRRDRGGRRPPVRRPGRSAAGLGPLRRPRLDAGHDGYGAQSRAERRNGPRAGRQRRRPPLRLGQLPPLHPDVRRRRARRRSRRVRTRAGAHQGTARRLSRYRTRRRRPGSAGRPLQGACAGTNPARPSRRIRTPSSGAPSAPSSAAG